MIQTYPEVLGFLANVPSKVPSLTCMSHNWYMKASIVYVFNTDGGSATVMQLRVTARRAKSPAAWWVYDQVYMLSPKVTKPGEAILLNEVALVPGSPVVPTLSRECHLQNKKT